MKCNTKCHTLVSQNASVVLKVDVTAASLSGLTQTVSLSLLILLIIKGRTSGS